MKKPISLSTMVIVVAVILLFLKAQGPSGDADTTKNPHPVSTVCNQYFKGGC